MICKAVCAFREPFKKGFVEAMYPGQEIDVPAALVDRLVADGHIERPAVGSREAPPEMPAAAEKVAEQEEPLLPAASPQAAS